MVEILFCQSHSRYGNTNYNLVNHGKVRSTDNNSVKLRKSAFRSRFEVNEKKTEINHEIAKKRPDDRTTTINDIGYEMVPTSELMTKIRKPEAVGSRKGHGEMVANTSSKLLRKVGVIISSREEKDYEEINFLITQEEQSEGLRRHKSFRWAMEQYKFFQRSVEVWTVVLSLYARIQLQGSRWTYLDGFTESKQKKRAQRTATWLREQILCLGPTFIKLGQFLSTRSDFLPLEFVNELSKLQDQVPAFSSNKAKGLIERELGAPVDVLFKRFDEQPIAAASLGQVHRAVLHNGEKVAVKVQRPGLKKLFDVDLQNLKIITEYFQRNEFLGGLEGNWMRIYEECARMLYEEIDFINEGRNADKFQRNFRKTKWVRVPVIHWDYTTSKVLTLEYMPGIKINQLDVIDARGYQRSQISARIIEAYLIQILKTGFYHGDPHPGNIAIDKDGALIYYDFGMMGEIKPSMRKKLLELFFAIHENDIEKVMQALIDLEVLQTTGDMAKVRRTLRFFLDKLYSDEPDQRLTLAGIGEDLFAIATDMPIVFPSNLTFIMKAFTTLEGIGYSLDPSFSFAKVAAPYIQEMLDIRGKGETRMLLVEEIKKQAEDARTYTVSMPYSIQRIEKFVKQLEAGEVKLHVRALESEKEAQKATMLQMATIHAGLGGTLLNLGITFILQDNWLIGNGLFIGAGAFLALFLTSMKKVKKLDKVDKNNLS